MKIKFTVTADFKAEVTEDVAYEVMKDYGGNFDAWMEDNYSDYTCESEFEVEDISYDKKEAAKTLSIIRKHIDEKGDTFLKSNLRSRLRNSKFPTAHIPALENMQKLEIDLELMEKIFEFADFNNPKDDLIFYTGVMTYECAAMTLASYKSCFPEYEHEIKHIRQEQELN